MKRYPLFFSAIFSFSFLLFLSAGTDPLRAQGTVPAADVPRTISYQGMLTNAEGVPIRDGMYDVRVTLYADPEGKTSIWNDTYRIPVTGGVFNLYLGDGGRALPGPDALNAPLWIGTAIDGANELRPLTPLAASPYALNVPDRAITTAKLSDGAVTAEKVRMNYVAGFRINGEEVSGNGTMLDLRSDGNLELRYDRGTSTVVIGSALKEAKAGDGEKGAQVQDVTFGVSNNWLGRNPALGGANWPNYSVPNAATSVYNTLGGGYLNTIRNNADSSTITGGSRNVIDDGSDCGFIGAGCGNEILANTVGNVIAGGITNAIDEGSDLGAIGGGGENDIGENSNYDVIGGGRGNAIGVTGGAVSFGTIGGGQGNGITSTADHGTIGGGLNNIVSNDYGTIGGGDANLVSAQFGAVAGGTGNRVQSEAGGIVSGLDNTISTGSSYSFIGGGNGNDVASGSSAIAGGANNDIAVSSTHSFIGGGTGNSIAEDAGVIGGGVSNTIFSTAANSAIVGGNSNLTRGDYSFIGGGAEHQILLPASYGTIGGGFSSIIDAAYGTIGGGSNHIVTTGAEYSTVGGGEGNRTVGSHSTISGGFGNITEGSHSTIIGGDLLQTEDSYAQVAVGFYNAPRGNIPYQPTSAMLTNDPLFMVGNGDVGASSPGNAFEVSYNGHSTVYHNNGIGAASPVVRGATYTDNVIYAWGLIDGDGTIICDFGVMAVDHIGPGTYEITVNLIDPLGEEIPIECMAITATVKGDECGLATASPGNSGPPATFTLFTHLIGGGGCELEDLPFMFHLTGRPPVE